MSEFKTSWECRLELVSHSVTVANGGADPYVDDLMPVRAARASYGKEDKTGLDLSKDTKLMNFLAEHEHLTPFEYQHATFLVEVPLFIRSQIMRHRTFSYNEISRRYTSDDIAFWIPEQLRAQGKVNKQDSGETLESGLSNRLLHHYRLNVEEAEDAYNTMLRMGVAREQARAVLPQSLLTRFYMGGNLRNWAHFIKLRRDPHAQKEVRIVAERIATELAMLWPESCQALGI